MKLVTDYRTEGVFTLAELRAIVAQTEHLSEDCDVYLAGTLTDDFGGDDVIRIFWEEA